MCLAENSEGHFRLSPASSSSWLSWALPTYIAQEQSFEKCLGKPVRRATEKKGVVTMMFGNYCLRTISPTLTPSSQAVTQKYTFQTTVTDNIRIQDKFTIQMEFSQLIMYSANIDSTGPLP